MTDIAPFPHPAVSNTPTARVLGAAAWLRALPAWTRLAIASLAVAASAAGRWQDGGHCLAGAMPAVVLAGLLLGGGSGIWALLVGLAAAVAVHGHGGLPASTAVDLCTGLVAALTAEAMHEALDRAAAANGRLSGACARLEATERTKDLLLHEIAHRFRNDLSNLAALLRMQARDAGAAAAARELAAASERVAGLGRVHSRLSATGATGEVDAGRFLLDLCVDLKGTTLAGRPVDLRCETVPAALPIPHAVTLGLIANELVTNAAKHAFPGGAGGTVAVTLERSGPGLVLKVSDDGIGDAGIPREGSGLGQRLVTALSRQLEGVFETSASGDGRQCAVAFPFPPRDPNRASWD